MDVGEERRDDSALRRSGESRREPPSLLAHSRTEERSQQRQHSAVADAPSYLAHQNAVPHVIEARLDISLDYVFVRGARVDVANDLRNRILSSSGRSIPVTRRVKVGLEDWLQHELEGHLYDPVTDGRYAEVAHLATAFGDAALPHGSGTVHPCFKLKAHFLQKALDPDAVLDVPPAPTVQSGRS